MSNSGKVYDQLESFSKREWRAFAGYLKSQSEEQCQRVAPLFQLLWESQQTSGAFPSKMELAERLFSSGELQKVRYLESELSALIEGFWVKMELEEDDGLRQILLLKALRKRSLSKAFQKTLEKSQRQLEQEPLRDLHYLLRRHQLNSLAFEWASQQENRGLDPGLEEMLEDLESMYEAGSLKYGSLLVNLRNVVSVPLKAERFQKINALAQQDAPHLNVATQVYRTILLTLIESDQESHYTDLLALLEKESLHFTQEESSQQYDFALNYCIKKLNEGKGEYLQRLFELYQSLLEKRTIFQGPYIIQQHFKNIVTTAIRLEEFDWTLDFIQRYSKKVHPEARENAYTYNMAALHFARRSYSRALRLLQEVEFTDVYYHVDSKALLLKTYYELREWEPLLSLTEAFWNYLRRNRMISDYQRKVYWNFVKYAKKLVRKQLGSKKPVREILREMEELREIADLRWLRRKAEDLL